ncbi:MAG: hypothetical protein QW404_00520 [Candidatus Nanoarchaeia archaeon]
MDNVNVLNFIPDKQPTSEERKREVEAFKRVFNLDDLLKFVESNGFIGEMKKIPTAQERFFYFVGVLEMYYDSPNVDFGCYILHSFQKRHPEIDLGMCPQLSIDLGEDGYIKTCSPPGCNPFRTYCTGFRFDSCRDYKKY